MVVPYFESQDNITIVVNTGGQFTEEFPNYDEGTFTGCAVTVSYP